MPVEFKEGDNRPIYTEHLRRGARPIDLQDADEVQLKVKEADSETVVIDDTATIESALHGRVSYKFDEETTLPVGTYHAEFWIVWDAESDEDEAIPKSDYFELEINRRIDGEIDPEAWDDPDITVTDVYAERLLSLGALHKTHFEADERLEVPEGYGTVMAGPLTGEGEITGDGRLTVASPSEPVVSLEDIDALYDEIEDSVETHRGEDVHDQPQPPQPHDHAGDELGADEPLASVTAESAEADRVLGDGVVHKTRLEDGEVVEIPADHGSIVAGPLTGEGAITGDGRLKVI